MTPLKRQRHEMPDYIHEAHTRRHVMDAYLSRPDYQQNDYIGWITRQAPINAGEAIESNAGRTGARGPVYENVMDKRPNALHAIIMLWQERVLPGDTGRNRPHETRNGAGLPACAAPFP